MIDDAETNMEFEGGWAQDSRESLLIFLSVFKHFTQLLNKTRSLAAP